MLLPLLLALAAPASAQEGAVASGMLGLVESKEEPHTRGLAVGVNRFADEGLVQLTYATPDAWAFRAALVQASEGAWDMADFPVLTDEAATKEAVESALKHALLDAGPEDTVVLFFSTHGWIQDGEGYLFAHDSDMAGLESNGLHMSQVSTWINESPAKHVLLFTDACHSGAMASGITRGEEGSFNKVLDSLGRAEGSFFSFSSSLVRQQSFEHWGYCGGAGAFTCGIRRALQGEGDLDGDGQVSLAELATAVPPIVMQLTSYKQTPEAKGDYDPGIILASRTSGVSGAVSAYSSGTSDSGYGDYGYGDSAYGFSDSGEELAGVLGYLGSSSEGSFGGLASLGVEGVEGGVMGGVVGGAYGEDYDSSYYDSDDWSYRWRPTFITGIRGGVALGSVSPQGTAGGAQVLDGGVAPQGALFFGLSERWWLTPTVHIRGLFISGSPAPGVEDSAVSRLGIGFRNQIYVLPYATFTPYVPLEVELDGAAWSEASSDATWALKPFSRTSLGTGLGLEAYPWWSGSTSFSLEVTQHLSLAGPDAAPDAATLFGRPTVTRIGLVVDRVF